MTTTTATKFSGELTAGMLVHLDGTYRTVQSMDEDSGLVILRIQGFRTPLTCLPSRKFTVRIPRTVPAGELAAGMRVRLDGTYRTVQDVTTEDGLIRARIQGFATPFTFTPDREVTAC